MIPAIRSGLVLHRQQPSRTGGKEVRKEPDPPDGEQHRKEKHPLKTRKRITIGIMATGLLAAAFAVLVFLSNPTQAQEPSGAGNATGLDGNPQYNAPVWRHFSCWKCLRVWSDGEERRGRSLNGHDATLLPV